MSRALTKKEQQQQLAQQHSEQEQHVRDVETQEHHSSANASAGLNLNLFGALSGAMSSTKRKETHHKPDGSKHTLETSHDKAAGSGYAAGQGNAHASGAAQDSSRHTKGREIGQGQQQSRITAKQGQKQVVDHLGIEN